MENSFQENIIYKEAETERGLVRWSLDELRGGQGDGRVPGEQKAGAEAGAHLCDTWQALV